MGSVRARGDTFLTFGLKALTETNTSRLATEFYLLWPQRSSSGITLTYPEVPNKAIIFIIFLSEYKIMQSQQGSMIKRI
jgi:hypothetical protein